MFLEVFKYLRASKKHSFETPGFVFFKVSGVFGVPRLDPSVLREGQLIGRLYCAAEKRADASAAGLGDADAQAPVAVCSHCLCFF